MSSKQSATSTTPVQYTPKAVNPENVGYNERRLTVLRMALSSFGGCVAGVLGLSWEKGLVFFLVISLIIFFALFFFKIGAGQWKKNFVSFSSIWKSGLVSGFMVKKIIYHSFQFYFIHSFIIYLFIYLFL